MKLLIIIAGLLVAFDGWSYNETDLLKLKQLNQCISCDLSGANLSGANLGYAWLQRANLRNANLRGAEIRYTDLREADLTGADLTGANLQRANLREADLTGANLTDTDLATKGPSLINVKLDGVIYCRTKMPWGELNDGCE